MCVYLLYTHISWVASADICIPGPFDSVVLCSLQSPLHDKHGEFISFDGRVFDQSWPASTAPHDPWLALPDHFRFGDCRHRVLTFTWIHSGRVWEHISQTELLIVPNYLAGNERLLSFKFVSVLYKENDVCCFLSLGFQRSALPQWTSRTCYSIHPAAVQWFAVQWFASTCSPEFPAYCPHHLSICTTPLPFLPLASEVLALLCALYSHKVWLHSGRQGVATALEGQHIENSAATWMKKHQQEGRFTTLQPNSQESVALPLENLPHV